MKNKKEKSVEDHCFKNAGKTLSVTIPKHIVKELKIVRGEDPEWDKEKYRSGKKLTVKITRGETIYDG